MKARERKIPETMEKIPGVEAESIERDVKKSEILEFVVMKRNLWKKWQGKTEISDKESAIPKEQEKITRGLYEIEKKINEYKVRKEEQLMMKDRKKEEWKTRNKMIMEDHWGILRWLHQYMKGNKNVWEKKSKRKKEGIDEDYEMGKGMDEEEMIKLLMEREEKIKNWEEKKSIRRKEQKEMRKYIEDWRMMSSREEEPKVIDN